MKEKKKNVKRILQILLGNIILVPLPKKGLSIYLSIFFIFATFGIYLNKDHVIPFSIESLIIFMGCPLTFFSFISARNVMRHYLSIRASPIPPPLSFSLSFLFSLSLSLSLSLKKTTKRVYLPQAIHTNIQVNSKQIFSHAIFIQFLILFCELIRT